MKTSGIPLSSLPPRLQAQVRAQIDAGLRADPKDATLSTPTTFAGLEASAMATVTKRLRQSSKGPNKTEAAFAAYLRAESCSNGDRPLFEQSVTLKLANGLRYTPDIFRPLPTPVFFEVKGFMRDDAAAKIKMAASLHRWATFYLVSRRGRTCGGWDIQQILR